MKEFFSNRRNVLLVVTLILTAVAVYALLQGKPVRQSTVDIYNAALKDLRAKNYAKATDELAKVKKEAPGYKDTATVMANLADKLLKDARQELAAKNYAAAGNNIALVEKLDPGNQEAAGLVNQMPGVGSGTGTNNGDVTGGKLIEIPSDATPISLLPKTMAGYLISQNGWLQQPVQAGSTYLPKSEATKKQVDRILLTVAVYKTEKDAAAREKREKSTFPNQPKDVTVNGHSAYFGSYTEIKPEVFPTVSQLLWRRGKWYFSLQILPMSFPGNQYKLLILEDVAAKVRY